MRDGAHLRGMASGLGRPETPASALHIQKGRTLTLTEEGRK